MTSHVLRGGAGLGMQSTTCKGGTCVLGFAGAAH